MVTDYDSTWENLVKSLTPDWKEMRVKKHIRFGVEKSPSIVSEVLLIGEQSLLVFVDWKNAMLQSGQMDYFPIFFKIVDPSDFLLEKYTTFAKIDGSTDLDQRLRWLFDQPFLRLIEASEGMADGMGQDANWDYVHYYGGVELKDSSGKKALQIIGTQETDLTLELKIKD